MDSKNPNHADPAVDDLPSSDKEIPAKLRDSVLILGTDDPNEGTFSRLGPDPATILKSLDLNSITEYATLFSEFPELAKSAGLPPVVPTFNQIRTMPADSEGGKLLQWPGIQPATLYKLVSEHIAPQMIIGMRVDDVRRYSQLSTHTWRPGWRIEMRNAISPPTEAERKMIRKAEEFIRNSGDTYATAIERDEARLLNFADFLGAIVRNTLTYDGIAIWTDRDQLGRVKSFKVYNAGNIRLIADIQKDGKPEVTKKSPYFAALIDDAYRVVKRFTRDDLVWSIRNRRLEPDVDGYGLPEPEIAARLIQGLSNAIELNLDIFDKNSIPAGILKLKGGFRQKDIDFLGRIWTNIKRGRSKAWTLPAVKVPTDGDVELLELSSLKDKDGYYKEWINMMFGVFCTVYRFPVQRLGYHPSGTTRDTEVDSNETVVSDRYDDPGLEPLLNHLETIINEYLLWSRFPELEFHFTGKSPAEDARQFQVRTNSMTLGERRASSDLPPLWELEEAKEDEEFKRIAKLMSLVPTDSSLATVFQSIVSALIKGGEVSENIQGAIAPPQKDPAISEQHGHLGGVRRNSAQEKGKTNVRGMGRTS